MALVFAHRRVGPEVAHAHALFERHGYRLYVVRVVEHAYQALGLYATHLEGVVVVHGGLAGCGHHAPEHVQVLLAHLVQLVAGGHDAAAGDYVRLVILELVVGQLAYAPAVDAAAYLAAVALFQHHAVGVVYPQPPVLPAAAGQLLHVAAHARPVAEYVVGLAVAVHQAQLRPERRVAAQYVAVRADLLVYALEHGAEGLHAGLVRVMVHARQRAVAGEVQLEVAYAPFVVEHAHHMAQVIHSRGVGAVQHIPVAVEAMLLAGLAVLAHEQPVGMLAEELGALAHGKGRYVARRFAAYLAYARAYLLHVRAGFGVGYQPVGGGLIAVVYLYALELGYALVHGARLFVHLLGLDAAYRVIGAPAEGQLGVLAARVIGVYALGQLSKQRVALRAEQRAELLELPLLAGAQLNVLAVHDYLNVVVAEAELAHEP